MHRVKTFLRTHLNTPRRKMIASAVAGVAILTLGVVVLQNAFAQDEDVLPLRASDRLVWSGELQREIALQRQRHRERLDRLETLKQQMIAADAPAGQIESLDQAIAAEKADYAARMATLRRWRETNPAFSADRLQGAMDAEWRDLGEAIGSLNQSFVIPPIRTRSAWAGGSRYNDVEPDPEDAPPAERRPRPEDLD